MVATGPVLTFPDFRETAMGDRHVSPGVQCAMSEILFLVGFGLGLGLGFGLTDIARFHATVMPFHTEK